MAQKEAAADETDRSPCTVVRPEAISNTILLVTEQKRLFEASCKT